MCWPACYVHLAGTWSDLVLPPDLHSSWHKLNKLLEMFPRDLGPYWRGSVTQLLRIYQLSVSHVTTSQRSSLTWGLECRELLVMLEKPPWDLQQRRGFLQETAVRRFTWSATQSVGEVSLNKPQLVQTNVQKRSTTSSNCATFSCIKMFRATGFKKEANTVECEKPVFYCWASRGRHLWLQED